jgi:hypothetical protein
MANFDTFYRGGTPATVLPTEKFEQASERLSDLLIRTAETKHKIFKENQKQFLETGNIEPEFVIADSARKNTTDQIEQFNKKWASIQASRPMGQLSTKDLQDMATQKNLIMSQNQKDVVAMQKYIQMKDMVAKDPLKYNKDRFLEWEDEYLSTGNFNYTTPPIKGVNPLSFFSDDKNRLEATIQPMVVDTKGTQMAERTPMASEEEAKAYVESLIMNRDDFRQGVIDAFASLKNTDFATYKKYLDVNKDGTISEEEKQAAEGGNPIVQWAKDTYWKNAVKVKQGAMKTIPWTTGTKSEITSVNIAGGTIKVAPGTRRANGVTYDKKYPTTYAFNGVTVKNIPTRGGEELSGYGEYDLTAGNVAGEILDYIPTEDKVILRVTGGGENPDVSSKTIIKIPARNIEGIDNLPIRTEQGVTTLGAIRAKGTPSLLSKTGGADARSQMSEFLKQNKR